MSAHRTISLSCRTGAAVPLLVLLCCVSREAAGQPFYSGVVPSGVATDVSGNVYIASIQGGSGSAAGTPILTKLDASGKQLFQLPIDPLLSQKSGGATSGSGGGAGATPGSGGGSASTPTSGSGDASGARWGAGRLVYDDTLGTLWYLSPVGQLLYINPDDGASGLLVDMAAQSFDTSKTIDVSEGMPQTLFADGSFQQAAWGDLELLYLDTARSDTIEADFFLTGVTAGVHFGARVRFAFTAGQPLQIQFLGAEVNVASRQSEQDQTPPGGIGVDFQKGNVYTTLPIKNKSGSPEHLVSYPFDLGLAKSPSVTIGDEETSSRGITTDESGNLYVATGPAGTSICTDQASGTRLAGGLLLMRRPDGSARCFYWDSAVDSRDVAISSDGKVAYLTLGLGNEVVTLDLYARATSTQASGPAPVKTMDFRGRILRDKRRAQNAGFRLRPRQ